VKDRQNLVSMLVCEKSAHKQDTFFVEQSLKDYPIHLLKLLVEKGCRVICLDTQRYADASPELKHLGIDVDAWPNPPAGLFVVAERTVYLRQRNALTLTHELGHALDCALGNGVYFSSSNKEVKSAFINAIRFVTPYAATSLDEYFAECVRAYMGVNAADSPWPRVSGSRLREYDPAMYSIIHGIFSEGICSSE